MREASGVLLLLANCCSARREPNLTCNWRGDVGLEISSVLKKSWSRAPWRTIALLVAASWGVGLAACVALNLMS